MRRRVHTKKCAPAYLVRIDLDKLASRLRKNDAHEAEIWLTSVQFKVNTQSNDPPFIATTLKNWFYTAFDPRCVLGDDPGVIIVQHEVTPVDTRNKKIISTECLELRQSAK